ncbi:hypothetical protein [Cytobacillus gottheilii]|uniref:hypothetical protein n=1 Tax=Cytobacillus gottheilii TaxID=859144 RepID=UPI0024957B61|nr:hypothetical protein [Cytobacillus gottheilii]
MLSIAETMSIHFFFILNCMFDMYQYWVYQMIYLTDEVKDEELPLWGMPASKETVVEVITQETNYEETEISNEQLAFAEALASSLVNDDCLPPEDPNQEYEEIGNYSSTYNHQEALDHPAPAINHEIESISATARIKDFLMGEQSWIAEVVGEEQGYLHISDGTARTWVNANPFGQFFKGDILSLSVIREGEHINLLGLTILQRKSSDFVIYDEEEGFEHLEFQREIVA